MISRLTGNGAQYERLESDSLIQVESYYIDEFTSAQSPYEGHFPHRSMVVHKTDRRILFKKGDYIFPVRQRAGRFLVETLEPEATDSYFRWNFFDTILQQKEGFSPYVFEDLAMELLNENAELKAAFEKKKAEDSTFASNWYAQLDYIYEHSPYRETAHRQYPVYRYIR